MGELLLRILFNPIHWGLLVVALILLVVLIRLFVPSVSRPVSSFKESPAPVTEVDAPQVPLDPDEEGPGTYGGPYNRHPKFPPGGGS